MLPRASSLVSLPAAEAAPVPGRGASASGGGGSSIGSAGSAAVAAVHTAADAFAALAGHARPPPPTSHASPSALPNASYPFHQPRTGGFNHPALPTSNASPSEKSRSDAQPSRASAASSAP